MNFKRSAPKVAGLAAMSVLVLAAAAYACTALATLNLSAPSGPVGTNVVAKGAAFSTAPGASPVVLHLDRADGPVLGQATPDRAGNFSVGFAVPQTEAGHHAIVATQLNAKGQMAYGTPARTSFQVVGPGAQAGARPPTAAPSSEPATSGSSVPALALTAALGLIGLVLLAAGSASFFQARREGPAAARR